MSAVANRAIPRTVYATNGASVRTKRGNRYVTVLSTWTGDGDPSCVIVSGSDCLLEVRKRMVRYWRTLPGPTRTPYGEGTTWQVFDLAEIEPVTVDAVCECDKCGER